MDAVMDYCDFSQPAVVPVEFPWLDRRSADPVFYGGAWYPTAENAFQAARFKDGRMRRKLSRMLPASAAYVAASSKDAAPDWDGGAIRLMYDVMERKFSDPVLRRKLLSTGMRPILMRNTYHDNLWGSCCCRKCRGLGENRLGVVLEKLRHDLRDAQDNDAAGAA